MSIEENLQPIFGLLPKIKNKECVRDVTHILNGLMHSDRWALQRKYFYLLFVILQYVTYLSLILCFIDFFVYKEMRVGIIIRYI